MTIQLPDGLYPFINERLPLSELTMIEAPADLERFCAFRLQGTESQ